MQRFVPPDGVSGILKLPSNGRTENVGSPERVIELMKIYMQKSGTNHWMAQMRVGGLEHEKVLRSMELFAKHVMPALRQEEAKTAAV